MRYVSLLVIALAFIFSMGISRTQLLRSQAQTAEAQAQTAEALKAAESYKQSFDKLQATAEQALESNKQSFDKLKSAFDQMAESNTKNENTARRCAAVMRGARP